MLTVTSGQLEAWLAAYLWPFIRILAIFSSAPILMHRSIPLRAKVGLAFAITILVAPTLPTQPGGDPLWLLLQQLAVGFAIGFAVQLVFAAFELAGDLIGLQMGLSFATFVDPQNSTSTPLVGSFLTLIATLIFLAINGHLMMLAGVVESFKAVPIGALTPGGMDFHKLVLLGSEMFRLGLHFALPALAVMLIINLALGVLGRAAPQLNLFAVGFPATLLIGLLALMMVMPFAGAFIEDTLGRGVAAALSFGR